MATFDNVARLRAEMLGIAQRLSAELADDVGFVLLLVERGQESPRSTFISDIEKEAAGALMLAMSATLLKEPEEVEVISNSPFAAARGTELPS